MWKFRTNISIVIVWLIVSLKWNYVKRNKNASIEYVSFVFSKVNTKSSAIPNGQTRFSECDEMTLPIQIQFNVLFIELHWINDQVNFHSVGNFAPKNGEQASFELFNDLLFTWRKK